ncbi:MAG: phosphatase PAP2 family protein [Acidaminococcaceae bacterium]|nr:phosphatase PAP2 family protein [Acidaminococcaceae bacterium]
MSRKRLMQINFCNIAGIFLFLSWYLPKNHGFWFTIDKNIFFFFNKLIGESSTFLYLVAVTNFRAFDSVAFIFMLGIFLYYFIRQDAVGKRRMFCMGIAMLLSVILVKLADGWLNIKRASASLYFANLQEPVNFVSQMTGWHVKDHSSQSFPGDHGMMLLIFTSFMGRYFGKKAFLSGLLVFLVFSLPRIMSGAHWFTDIAVGSVSIVLVVMSWVLLTPFSDRIIHWLESKLPLSIFKKFG